MECDKTIRGHKVADFLSDKECKLIQNSLLATGLGGGGVELQLFWGISSPPRVSVVGSDTKPDFWDCWGRREIFISREPRVQKCTNLFATLPWAQGQAVVELNCSYFGYFKSADGFGGRQ